MEDSRRSLQTFSSKPCPSALSSLPPPFSHSVQSLSRVRLSATPWITARQASLSITITSHSHISGETSWFSFNSLAAWVLFVTPQVRTGHREDSDLLSKLGCNWFRKTAKDRVLPPTGDSMCMCVCVCVCVHEWVCVSEWVWECYVCECVCVSKCVSECVWVLCVWVSVSECEWMCVLCVWVWVGVWVLCVWVCVCECCVHKYVWANVCESVMCVSVSGCVSVVCV